jgi:hypothetical protein
VSIDFHSTFSWFWLGHLKHQLIERPGRLRVLLRVLKSRTQSPPLQMSKNPHRHVTLCGVMPTSLYPAENAATSLCGA